VAKNSVSSLATDYIEEHLSESNFDNLLKLEISKQLSYSKKIYSCYKLLNECCTEFSDILLSDDISKSFVASNEFTISLDLINAELDTKQIPVHLRKSHKAFQNSLNEFMTAAVLISQATGIMLNIYDGDPKEVKPLTDRSLTHIKLGSERLIEFATTSLEVHIKQIVASKEAIKQYSSMH